MLILAMVVPYAVFVIMAGFPEPVASPIQLQLGMAKSYTTTPSARGIIPGAED
jgi:hypothetical protein